MGKILIQYIYEIAEDLTKNEELMNQLELSSDDPTVFVESMIAFIFSTRLILPSIIKKSNIMDKINNEMINCFVRRSFNKETQNNELESYKQYIEEKIYEYNEAFKESISHNVPLLKVGRLIFDSLTSQKTQDGICSQIVTIVFIHSYHQSLINFMKKYKITL